MVTAGRHIEQTGFETPRAPERLAWIALAFPLSTLLYYFLPSPLQGRTVLLFLPQAAGYLGLAIWLRCNRDAGRRLGLSLSLLPQGLRWGTPVGAILGCVNTAIILWVVPVLGGDIAFLRETPHARLPVSVMLPWAIVAIAIAVELNFRGFLLGRLYSLYTSPCLRMSSPSVAGAGAVVTAALVFSFDPFMVATFQHLHWIAIWDGLVWGAMWLRLKNLYATIVAHALEVIILYVVLRTVLGD